MKTQELPEEEASAATAPATAPEKEQSSRTLEGLQDSSGKRRDWRDGFFCCDWECALE